MTNEPIHPVVHLEYPDWVDEVVNWQRRYASDHDKMHVAIAVSRMSGPAGPEKTRLGGSVLRATDRARRAASVR